LTNSTRLEAEELAKKSLLWMESSGMVKSITVNSALLSIENLGLFLTFEQPLSSSTTRFKINWDSMRVKI